MSKDTYIPPDGGWGWIVVIGFALYNIITIPIMQGFGMIYGNTFKHIGISATQSTIIINVNQAFGMVLGLMNGPMLRRFGYRKVAVLGSLLYAGGAILTSFASSFVHFIITYGMMTSLGMSMGIAAGSLAVNTYFKEKRARAMGISWAITGLGPIFVPHLTSFLLPIYDSEGTMFILGALSLHALVGACLLQPIKWHAKRVSSQENEQDDLKDDATTNCITQGSVALPDASTEISVNDTEIEKKKNRKRSRTITMSSADINDDNISIYGFETPVTMQTGSLFDVRGWNEDDPELDSQYEDSKKFQRKLSLSNFEFDYKRSNSMNDSKSRKFSVSSMKYGDNALTKKILADFPEEDGELTKTSDDDRIENGTYTLLPSASDEPADSPEAAGQPREKKQRCWLVRCLRAIAHFFDLGLLRDPTYVNIMLGMSIAIFAELNFSVLTPFILADMHLTTEAMAMVLSVLSTADLVVRVVAPYVGEWLRKPPRVMYVISLLLLILTRSALLFANTYAAKLSVAVGLGIAKGVRTVYMPLVIPSHVPLERLASASSIQSLVNGFLLLAAGPFLGVVRDLTGSYVFCIIFINFVTAITIIMWLAEYAFKRFKQRRKLKAIKK